MGTIGDGLRKGAIAAGMSYSGRFRYHAEFGKGLVVSRMGIQVYEFDGTPGGTSPLNLYSGKDNSIVIALEHARHSKRLALHTPAPMGLSNDPSHGEFSDTLNELFRLRDMGKQFFLSFAVQKNTNGKKIEMLVLQDNAASLGDVGAGTGNGRVRYDFVLKAPEVKAVSLAR